MTNNSAASDTFTWIGTPANGEWGLASNWEDLTTVTNPSTIAPGAGSTVTIDSTSGPVSLTGTGDSASLTFVGFNTVMGQLTTTALNASGLGQLSVSAGGTLTAATADLSTNGVNIAGQLVVSGALSNSGAALSEISVSGGGGITAGSVSLSGADVGITIDSTSSIGVGSATATAGALTVASGATFASSAGTTSLQGNVVDNGTLNLGPNADITGTLSGAGSVVVGAGETLELNSTSGFTGTISMAGGTLDFSGIPFSVANATTYDSATGLGTLDGGSLDIGTGQGWFSTVSDGHGGTDLVESSLPPAGEVVLSGLASQYVVADDSGLLYIQAMGAGTAENAAEVLPAGTEMVFSNGIGIFDPTGAAEDVSRLYQAALDRAPDVAGLEYWTAQINASNLSLATEANVFAAAPEFIADYGTLSTAGFVNQLYENVLDRAADAAGAAYWEGLLNSGVSRGEVLLSFAESPENEANTISAAGDQNNAEAYRLYQAAFNRVPDAPGETYWSAVLANGATPTQVAQDFVSSAEFQSDFAAATTPSAFVTQLYENVLDRAPDAPGLSYWTGVLQHGASQATVLLAFSDCLENRIDTAAATHANWVFIPS